MFDTPVALIIFRRPEMTRRLMTALAEIQPRKLFIIADGPRSDRPSDVKACNECRTIVENVTWPCEVFRNYAPVNMKCGWRVASGITWLFDNVEQAIILEDDCLPHPSFFGFCEEMLSRYKNDERIMHIAGCTYRPAPWPTSNSYYFSCFNGAWGWATWRRAWQHFDLSVKLWPELKSTSWLTDILGSEPAAQHWQREFDSVFHVKGDQTWDHQWTFACWANSGLSVVPKYNLVSNIGCGPEATHTLDANDPRANLPLQEVTFPLTHPPTVLRNYELDKQRIREVILPRLITRIHPLRSLRNIASRVAPEAVKLAYRSIAASWRRRYHASGLALTALQQLDPIIEAGEGVIQLGFFIL